jgi:toxin FitB
LMIIVDTNVISERLRPKPDENVLGWYRATSQHDMWTTTITAAELRAGAAVLPQGKRRAELESVIADTINDFFIYHLLSFDKAASEAYGAVIESRRKDGSPIQVPDAQIAAICISEKAMLATRNTKDFEGLGITLINPWEY